VIALHRKALQISGEPHRFFRIEVKAEDSPISTVHKILKKIGRRGEKVCQPRRWRRGKRPRIYKIADTSEHHQRFLEAARRKASAGWHTLRNEAKKISHSKACASAENAGTASDSADERWYSPDSIRDIALMISDIGREFAAHLIQQAGGPLDLIDLALAG
jgi:hypothetical protein